MRYFTLSFIVTVVGLWLAYLWGGVHGFVIASLLTLMEVTLSFDNAVVNATVLRHMSAKWQQRFLTWGILIAVFGMRLLFPLVIVAFATGLSMSDVTQMALNEPSRYSAYVLDSHIEIAAFGGMFLLMVFLNFFIDHEKDVHWLHVIEKRLVKVGHLDSASILLAMVFLLVMQDFLPEEDRARAMMAGTIGVLLHVAMSGMTSLMAGNKEVEHATMKKVAYTGFMGFMYLQVLDSAFSLDGVIGAFAMSKDVVIIMLGLGIGAMFVRSMTIYIVRKGTLDEYVFLEHGAHYGIGALGAIMLITMFVHVPEIITGLIGLTFVGLSLVSSIRHKRQHLVK